MRVAMRVDSSVKIGSGHLMRCLTLAEKLRQEGAEVSFLCRQLEGNLNEKAHKAGFVLMELPAPAAEFGQPGKNPRHASWLEVKSSVDADQTFDLIKKRRGFVDWLVVDHYGLDSRWHSKLRPLTGAIMVIDDLADRKLDCDLLLDQNINTLGAKRYENLVNDSCEMLIGPEYALLRSEFVQANTEMARQFDSVKNILIFLGGADPDNVTATTLEAVLSSEIKERMIKVIVGGSNPNRNDLIKSYASDSRVKIYENVDDMAKLLASSDLAIGAAGTSSWERASLGLPTIAIAIAENQILIGENCDRAGIALYVGDSKSLSVDKLKEVINSLVVAPERLQRMSELAMATVDGFGSGRVVKRMAQLTEAGIVR